MNRDKMIRIEELKQSIARGEYVVDAASVADVIVERTLARHREALERVQEHAASLGPRERRTLNS